LRTVQVWMLLKAARMAIGATVTTSSDLRAGCWKTAPAGETRRFAA
jgi:hypothetical protein